MIRPDSKSRTLLSRFRRQEDGGATIEALLWIPLALAFFSILADATMIFTGETRAMRIVYDANRKYAAGLELTTCAQVEAYVLDRLSVMSPNAQARCTVDTINETVYTQVSMPASDLDISGFVDVFQGLNVRVGSMHLVQTM